MIPSLLAVLILSVYQCLALQGPLSPDFVTWLGKNGYSASNFVRSDLGVYGSYGGKTSPNQTVKNTPVIFFHGNSDQALNPGTGNPYGTGWTKSINYFLGKGYTSAELYATTWGPADSSQATQQTHSCAYITRLRKFVQAVLAYTGSSTVSIVSHSMGVTLGRGVIKGGQHNDKGIIHKSRHHICIRTGGGSCSIGSLMTSVDTFVGISGANRGLAACFFGGGGFAPTCNDINGFDPGYCWMGFCKGNTQGLSEYLAGLNGNNPGYEAKYVFTIWSHGDELIGGGDLVYGYPTSEIYGQKGEKVYWAYGHMQCKDETAAVQYNMITSHSV